MKSQEPDTTKGRNQNFPITINVKYYNNNNKKTLKTRNDKTQKSQMSELTISRDYKSVKLQKPDLQFCEHNY